MLSEVAPIEKIGIRLLLKAPFYGHFLIGIPKSFDETIDTAQVALYGRQVVQMKINPFFWTELSEQHQLGLIQHEVLHLALRHLTLAPNYAHRNIYNIAADLVVNQYIEPELLPPGSITLDQLKPLEAITGSFWEQEQGVDYYYSRVLEIAQMLPGINPSGEAIPCAIAALSSWLHNGNAALNRHASWNEIATLSSSEQRIIEQFIGNATKQALERTRTRQNGGLPRTLWKWIEDLNTEPPRVNWRRALRLFTASGTSTFLKNTIRRPSKRYGVVPGVRLHKRHELALAIDTSGSVTTDEIRLFFNEIWQIWRRGANITIIECDARIRRVYLYSGIPPDKAAGRGGTSFDEPIAWANEQLPDALIYFTDGQAPAPAITARVPLLWVITPQGRPDASHLPGRIIRMLYE